MGSIILFSKDEADKLKALGFNYTASESANNVMMYSFIDTPEIRQILNSRFAAVKFTVSKTVNF